MANISKRRICVVQSHAILVPRANWVGGKAYHEEKLLVDPSWEFKGNVIEYKLTRTADRSGLRCQ